MYHKISGDCPPSMRLYARWSFVGAMPEATGIPFSAALGTGRPRIRTLPFGRFTRKSSTGGPAPRSTGTKPTTLLTTDTFTRFPNGLRQATWRFAASVNPSGAFFEYGQIPKGKTADSLRWREATPMPTLALPE